MEEDVKEKEGGISWFGKERARGFMTCEGERGQDKCKPML